MKTEAVIEAIKKTNGNLAAVARMLGVARLTIYRAAKAHPTIQAALDESRETMKDTAESVLYRKVLEGSTPELIFFMKTQCRDRGYIERVDHTMRVSFEQIDSMSEHELDQFIADLQSQSR